MHLFLIRGEQGSPLVITCSDPDGNALNLTDAVVVFTIKFRLDGEELIRKASDGTDELEIVGNIGRPFFRTEDTEELTPAIYHCDAWVDYPLTDPPLRIPLFNDQELELKDRVRDEME